MLGNNKMDKEKQNSVLMSINGEEVAGSTIDGDVVF